MAGPDDAFEILAANDRVDETLIEGVDAPKARTLFVEITSKPREPHRRPERTVGLRLVLVIAIALLAAVSIAMTWYFVRGVTDPISVGCYQAPSLDSDIAAVAAGGALNVRLCEPAWEDGTLTNTAVAPAGQVPPLIGCVTDNGNFAVFPGEAENLCQLLGLADPTPQSLEDGDAIRRLKSELVAYFDANKCQSIEGATADIRNLIHVHGLDDWQIRVTPGPPGRPCASFGLDSRNEAIVVVPIPPPD